MHKPIAEAEASMDEVEGNSAGLVPINNDLHGMDTKNEVLIDRNVCWTACMLARIKGSPKAVVRSEET